MLQRLLNDLRQGNLLVVYDALEGENQRGLEVVTSPTGLRVPDNQLIDVMDNWYTERFKNENRSLKSLGEMVLSKTSLSPQFVLLMYVDQDPYFDRGITDKRKGQPFSSFMKGTRLSPSGIAVAESLLEI